MSAAVALAACALAATSTSAASASETTTIPAKWRVFAVGPREDSLEVRVDWGACQEPDYHATVLETPTTVAIGIVQAALILTGPDEGCEDMEAFGALTIPLAAPLGGRRLEALPTQAASGPPLAPIETPHQFPQETCSRIPHHDATPRLIGFAPADARHVLERCGLRVRFRPTRARAGLARVVAQTPAAGALVALDGIVTLRVAG